MSRVLDTLPLRLLEARKSAGISQVKCAAKLGVSDRSYKLYELGRREISLAAVVKFSEELEVDLLWLLTGKGHQTPRPTSNLVSETIAAVVARIDPDLSPKETEKWGKKGEFIYNLALKNGTSPKVEAKVVFETFE